MQSSQEGTGLARLGSRDQRLPTLICQPAQEERLSRLTCLVKEQLLKEKGSRWSA